ncbi:YccF domain-containing protein [Haloferax sp. DFSO60]|uniref:YccF domain-containing protein n=1 Tax=Haloferax sp. DFSO60 TaxID=3388652 RepID=UPI00397DF850
MADRSLLVRALWFIFIGWWATPVVVNIAWFLNATIIGIPLGIALINLVPTVLSLKESRNLSAEDGRSQHSLLVRVPYFIFVGWWLSWFWANAAAFFAVTIIGLPIAYWMFNRLPYVTSLYRFDG